MTDIIDNHQDEQQQLLDARIQQVRANQLSRINPIKPLSACKDCGDPLPRLRIEMRATRCTYCQTEWENK